MKLKLSELNPNPFKKEINGGKLNEEALIKIKSNIQELGLMGSIPVFKKENNFYIIAGHHRVQALKDTYGNNFEVEVTLHDYSDENILRGMVIENLTQRSDELVEVTENLNVIRKWLRSNVQQLNETKDGRPNENGSIRDIYSWLNKNGEIMSIGSITQYLRVYDNLDKRLLNKANKSVGGHKGEEEISIGDAINLARLPKNEQLKMKSILDETSLDIKGKARLISEYIEAPKEIKENVMNKEINIENIEVEIDRYNLDVAKDVKDSKITVENISKKIDKLIKYLTYSLSDSSKNMIQSIKYISILIKYHSDMDSKQKEKLDSELNKFTEILSRMEKIVSMVREKI